MIERNSIFMPPLFFFSLFELFTLLVEPQLSVQLLVCHVDGWDGGIESYVDWIAGEVIGVNDIDGGNYCDAPRDVMASFQNDHILKWCPFRTKAFVYKEGSRGFLFLHIFLVKKISQGFFCFLVAFFFSIFNFIFVFISVPLCKFFFVK